MSGRADSDLSPDTRAVDAVDGDDAEAAGYGEHGGQGDDAPGQDRQARQARWAAAGTGAALALAGAAAALLRLTGSVPALVPVAYACGAGTCALAAVLGSRGRTRRALWLLVAGLMVMALGDQFD